MIGSLLAHVGQRNSPLVRVILKVNATYSWNRHYEAIRLNSRKDAVQERFGIYMKILVEMLKLSFNYKGIIFHDVDTHTSG